MSEVAIIKCDCDHNYQDNILGNNIRYANKTNNGGRYTSCGSLKNTGGNNSEDS